MFLKQYFYHEHIRKAIIAFGTIFNQITVQRLNANGEIAQSVRVPLAYAPKDKLLTRVQAVPGTNQGSVSTILPCVPNIQCDILCSVSVNSTKFNGNC